ncbi:hypothetical protein [Streptomyces jumonjinensis]|uniref:Uncharacterized protein n=1 Tax=Streptomyces jumonjinensis TaxID=1945 RepID=A0A646KN13_STRJU|nr:hypothetical protein [Streptomyces jumonjinensis]MQT03437.1 hypothetical protein [Streptomyces jumonjinensis]
MGEQGQRLLQHLVPECPHCAHRHRFALLIGPDNEPLLFAGTQEVPVQLVCPETRQSFEGRITIGSNEQFLRIADPFAADHSFAAAEADPELAEWIRSSRQTSTEYCKTMLTASSAGVPVHFAVLQYLDISGRTGGWTTRAAALPALLYVLAAAAFALAQRPRLVQLADTSAAAFATLRRTTLRRIDRLARWGTTLFLLGSVGAFLVFAILLGR